MQILTIATNVLGLSYFHHTIGQYIIPSARYFAIHAIVNTTIVYHTFRSVWSFFQNPQTALFCVDDCTDPFPNLLTVSLHLYHVLCYNMKTIDKIHHIPAVLANLIMCLYPAGSIENFTFFFMMGLPGMLDYTMLVLVKYNLLESITEKKYNAILNMTVRMPALVVSSFATLQSIVLYDTLFISRFHLLCAIIICIHNFWNGTYFAFKAVESYVKQIK